MTTVVLDVWGINAKAITEALALKTVGDSGKLQVSVVAVLMKFGRVQVTLEVDGKQEPKKP